MTGHAPEAVASRGDALSPKAIAHVAEDKGYEKIQYDGPTLFALAALGGAFIALGGLFSTVAMAGATGALSYGVSRLLGGLVFSLGLILIVVGGAQLFTSDCLMIMTWASKRARLSALLRVWATVWTGNFVGALTIAALAFLSGHYKFGHGAVGATALYIAEAKSALPTGEAFFLGVLCNVLVSLAAWLAWGARSVSDKIVAVVFPVSAFVAAGFEHCVADMYFIPFGMFIANGAPDSFWSDLGRAAADVHISVSGFAVNLAAVTAGNWVGGALLVGGVYWFAYLRGEKRLGGAIAKTRA